MDHTEIWDTSKAILHQKGTQSQGYPYSILANKIKDFRIYCILQ